MFAVLHTRHWAFGEIGKNAFAKLTKIILVPDEIEQNHSNLFSPRNTNMNLDEVPGETS